MIAIPLMLLLQAASAAPPDAEAQALGVRLARTGGLAVLAPALIEKDVAELAGEDPSLTPAQKAELQRIGREQGAAALERVVAATGTALARRLSIDDLRVLVAQAEHPAAARWRAIQPAVLVETASVLGSIDLKKQVATQFCTTSGKLCNRN